MQQSSIDKFSNLYPVNKQIVIPLETNQKSSANGIIGSDPPSDPMNNQSNNNEGFYSVRDAYESRQSNESIRQVHLSRSTDYQGYGFHLQYNGVYFLVQKIEDGSPAQRGDLRLNDVILSINKQSTMNMPHAAFVEIVNSSSNVCFNVKNLNEYSRSNPQQTELSQSAVASPETDNNSSKIFPQPFEN